MTTILEIESEYRAQYGANAPLSTADMRTQAAWLRDASRPALGTTLQTPTQRQLARAATLMLRAARKIEIFDAAVAQERRTAVPA